MHLSKSRKLTVTETARLMGCNPQFLRIALQQGRFKEFGAAVKMRRWVYYINATRFYAYLSGRNLSSRVNKLDGRDAGGEAVSV